MRKVIWVILLCHFPFVLRSQNVSVNNSGAKADSSAILDVSSITKGLLPPRMTTDQIKAVRKPAAGLIAFNTNVNKPVYFDGVAWRFYNDSPMVPPVNGVNADKATAALNAHRTAGFNSYPAVPAVKWNDTLSKAAFNFAKDVAIPGNEVNTYTTVSGGIIFNYATAVQYNKSAYFAFCYFFPAGSDEKTMIDQGFTQYANDATIIGGLMNSGAKEMGMGYYNNRYYLLMGK
jgi:uncharacterized protein YkwD